MNPNQQAYLDYLRTEHWKDLRKVVFARDGRKCSRCPATTRLQVHHVKYRDRWEDTRPEALVVLCRDCHLKEHGRRRKISIWMPLYWGDFWSDVLGMTDTEIVAYMRAISAYWNGGGGLDGPAMKRVCKRSFATVSGKFVLEGELWKHPRLESLLESAKKF